MTISSEKDSSMSDGTNLPAKPYSRTEAEQTAIEAYAAAKKTRVPAPSMKVVRRDETAVEIRPNHADGLTAQTLMMSAIGTQDIEFLDGTIRQLSAISVEAGIPIERELNFMLAIVKGVQPRDEVEAMLATQMAAIHVAAMKQASRFMQAATPQQIDVHERALNKLSRTFGNLVETLKRYRSNGEQRMTVQHQHVNVNDGGQAVIAGGDVTRKA